MATTGTDHRAENQARAQLEGIREMVAALDEEKYAAWFAGQLSRQECLALLEEHGIDHDPDGDDDVTLQETVADALYVGNIETDDYDFDREAAEQRIQEDPLSVQVRSNWVTPGEKMEPAEYEILLCTGGPAVRMTGDLDEHAEPESAELEFQDWYTPWNRLPTDSDEESDMVTYAQQFYYSCE